MQILKNIFSKVQKFLKKTDVAPVEKMEEAKELLKEVASGLPIEVYIPQEETSKEVIGMSPVTVTETPATPNELSPAEAAEGELTANGAKRKPYKRKYYKKKPKAAGTTEAKAKPVKKNTK